MSLRRPAARTTRRSALASLTALAVGAGLTVLPATSAFAAQGPSSPTGTGDAARNAQDMTKALQDSIKASGAKNVILFIGDGMGDSEITVARNYAEGAGGRFDGIDALPLTGSYTTYSLNSDDKTIDYVTDSAASGTGWATGTKSYDGAIGVDVNGKAVPTMLEFAKANGKKTGNVSTGDRRRHPSSAGVSRDFALLLGASQDGYDLPDKRR